MSRHIPVMPQDYVHTILDDKDNNSLWTPNWSLIQETVLAPHIVLPFFLALCPPAKLFDDMNTCIELCYYTCMPCIAIKVSMLLI
jgi:hypothetical protein